jgi:hypothetical protein
MNLNGDEKRIRQLFREMSLDDRRRAPEFASVLTAAQSGMARSQNPPRSLRFVMTVAVVCAVLLIAMAVLLRRSTPQDPPIQASAPPAPTEEEPAVLPSLPDAPGPGLDHHRSVKRGVRHRRPSTRIEIVMKSLFAWRSPTASLLQTPNDELLRSLPRLGESLQTIKSYSPDQFN